MCQRAAQHACWLSYRLPACAYALSNFMYYDYCVSVCTYVHGYDVYAWKWHTVSQNTCGGQRAIRGNWFSFHPVDPLDQTEAVSLGGGGRYSLNIWPAQKWLLQSYVVSHGHLGNLVSKMTVTTKIQLILTYKAFTNSQNKMQKKEKTKKSVTNLYLKTIHDIEMEKNRERLRRTRGEEED